MDSRPRRSLSGAGRRDLNIISKSGSGSFISGDARRHRPDYWLLILSAALLSIGLVVVYSISPGLAATTGASSSYFVSKQLAAVGLGIAALIGAAYIPIKRWTSIANPLLIAAAIGSLVIMVFMAGFPLKNVGLIFGAVAIAAVLAIGTSPYRRDRLISFFHPVQDCQSVGYQACQALIAVGSGGLVGRGLGHGVQAYGYLPEAANDSIFAIMAEKFGFIGMSVVIGIYTFLFTRLKQIIESWAASGK